MKKYNYNERLIEKLNITSFIEKYNFDNELYNTAIFCALSSIDSHRYIQLISKEINEDEFSLSIIKTWFSFYNIEFQESDSRMVTFV